MRLVWLNIDYGYTILLIFLYDNGDLGYFSIISIHCAYTELTKYGMATGCFLTAVSISIIFGSVIV